jgi:ABC-2 type transport system ATP-binding protein
LASRHVSRVAAVEGIIVAEELRKSYGSVRAVDGVNLEVRAGEFFGILGPNGAGKTTTLEIIEGLRKPDSGRVSVLGQSPFPRNESLLSRIGVQLQASSFFDRLTAREQIQVFASLYAASASRADDMLETMGLGEKVNTRTDQLSGGQRQRLSLACALVHDPEIVFLDEPTAALDPQARRNLWDVLSGISESGRTVILTTHYLDEAEALCDRVAIMDSGQILEMDAPVALVRALDAPVRVSIEPTALTDEQARRLPGVDEILRDLESLTLSTREPALVLSALAERDALNGLQVRGATLEDVFLNLTGREFRA